MPPNPNNVESEVVTERGIHIYLYTNGALHILEERDNPESGIWLDSNDKRALYDLLSDQLEEIVENESTHKSN